MSVRTASDLVYYTAAIGAATFVGFYVNWEMAWITLLAMIAGRVISELIFPRKKPS